MFSVLLEDLPDSYRGVLLRTSFRVGIQISDILDEVQGYEGSDEYSKALIDSFTLLYGVNLPPADIALDGLMWFMRGGKRDSSEFNTKSKEDKELQEDEVELDDSETDKVFSSKRSGKATSFDFYYDSGKIYTAFLKAYHIDLNTASLHWFQFLYMMDDLGECILSKAIEYRTADIGKLKGQQRKHYLKMRKQFSIPNKLTEVDIKHMESTGIDLDDYSMYYQY